MISFKRLTQFGRFGNQMFQYATLRSVARRLNVPFYCPSWLGDAVFALDDAPERAAAPAGIVRQYKQSKWDCGFDPRLKAVGDHTDLQGYFQSPRNFDAAAARQWFTFRPEAIGPVVTKYKGLGVQDSVGVHFRFGDIVKNDRYIDLKADYYRRALDIVGPHQQVLVFSDDLVAARELMHTVSDDFVLIEGNQASEDMYLLTQCKSVISSVSTFSWWGAWLNRHPDKQVVAPREWLRPGLFIRNEGLRCPDWTNLRTAHPIRDDYRTLLAGKVWRKGFGWARRPAARP